jgi:fructose-1-phosphate kinase PfkB-like protein
MKGTTVIVGLNAALQKRFVLPPNESLVPGNVHRAVQVQTGVGGKGQDVAITWSCLHQRPSSDEQEKEYVSPWQMVQFVGEGVEGDLVYQMLQDLLGASAMALTVRTKAGMRTCTSIVASDCTTELVEPSGTIESSEIREMMTKLKEVQADALCIMGSMPPGCPLDMYAQIYATVATSSTLCLIDSVVGLDPLLKEIAKSTPRGSVMLKINASELCRLADVHKSKSETGGVSIEDLLEAIDRFLAKNSHHALKALSALAITDGAHPAFLAVMPVADEKEFRLFQLPIAKIDVDESSNNQPAWRRWIGRQTSNPVTIYPIGAGDSVAAGTLAAWKVITDPPDANSWVHPSIVRALEGNVTPASRVMLAAFAFGLACGSASCLQEQNSVLKVQDVLDLYNKEGRPTFLSSHKVP